MRRRGFNLMEVVIAIALILALTGTMYGFLRELMATRDHAGSFSDRQRAANTLIDRVRSDLTTCIAGDPAVGAGVSGGESMLRIAARSVPASLASRGSDDPAVFADLHLSIYRFAPQRKRILLKREVVGDQKRNEQSEIPSDQNSSAPSMQPSTMNASQSAPFTGPTDDPFAEDASLMNPASEADATATGSLTQPQQSDEPPPLPAGFHALDGQFYKVRFRYHNGRTWQSTFNSQQSGSLPVAVEVAVWFNPWPGDMTDPLAQPGADSEQTQPQQSSRLTFDDTAGFDERAEAFASDIEQRDIPEPDRIAVIIVPDAQPDENTGNETTGSQSPPTTQQPTQP